MLVALLFWGVVVVLARDVARADTTAQTLPFSEDWTGTAQIQTTDN